MIPFESLVPRSRLWLDTISIIHELYGMRASFSLIQQFIFRRTNEWLGKFTLMTKIRKLFKTIKTGDCPTELGLDGMHVRSHQKHVNKNAVVLVATDMKKSEIMDYEWCDGETNENYLKLIKRLEQNFNLNPRDLNNLVSDGHHAVMKVTEGLSRYHTICYFHILQNIRINASNINAAKKLMHEAAVIFRQPSFAGAMNQFYQLRQKWKDRETSAFRNLEKSLIKTKDAWVSHSLSRTANVTERRIRDIRRKSKAMDNFRSQKTSEAVLEMVMEQIRNFKPFGNWFGPIQKRIFV